MAKAVWPRLESTLEIERKQKAISLNAPQDILLTSLFSYCAVTITSEYDTLPLPPLRFTPVYLLLTLYKTAMESGIDEGGTQGHLFEYSRETHSGCQCGPVQSERYTSIHIYGLCFGEDG